MIKQTTVQPWSHRGILCSVKRMMQAKIWMHPENIMLRERRQSQKNTCYMITLT